MKGVRLDAEGGGASLDNDKLVPVDVVDNGGPPMGAGKEMEASIDTGTAASKKVGSSDLSWTCFCTSFCCSGLNRHMPAKKITYLFILFYSMK